MARALKNNDALEMLLANETIVISRQEAVDEFLLQAAKPLRVDDGRVVVNPLGDRHDLASSSS